VERCFGGVPAATGQEVLAAGGEVDTEAVGRRAAELREAWRGAAKTENEARAELAALESFRGLSFTGRQVEGLKRTRTVFGLMAAEKFNALRLDPGAAAIVTEEARREGKRVWVLAAFRPADAEAAAGRLREHGFEELSFPKLDGSVEERIAELQSELEEVNGRRDEVRAGAAELAAGRREVDLALAHWEDQRELAAAAGKTVGMKRVGLLVGWVRERDLPRLEGVLAGELTCCSARFRDPALDEEPPVSIRLPGWLRPMQLLVNMFGMPAYRSVDATPFLSVCFLIFFGCCFGDVVYGLGLMALSLYVMRRYRHSWVKGFFQFFLYAGISSALFGLLTGTWMGDLLTHEGNAYVSAGNPLVRFANACTVFNPLKDPLNALVLSLIIGMATQFYGIIVKMVTEVRRRDYAAAAFDGGLWLLFLPGLTLLVLPMFMPQAARFSTLAWWLTGLGATGLVLTQGRKEESFMGKALTGVVSLYGIMGSYGATAFLSDVLSYSRLLALGLATSILGLSVNMMAGLLRDLHPIVGFILFVALVVAGHFVNFLMSILGAFVHPTRLILLEFFGRFYEPGGRKFVPLGFRSDKVDIVRAKGA